jgi:hypothetical protein
VQLPRLSTAATRRRPPARAAANATACLLSSCALSGWQVLGPGGSWLRRVPPRGAPRTMDVPTTLGCCRALAGSNRQGAEAPALPQAGSATAAGGGWGPQSDISPPLDLPPGFQEVYIDVAHQLADAAASVTRQYFRCDVRENGRGCVGWNGRWRTVREARCMLAHRNRFERSSACANTGTIIACDAFRLACCASCCVVAVVMHSLWHAVTTASMRRVPMLCPTRGAAQTNGWMLLAPSRAQPGRPSMWRPRRMRAPSQ